MPPGTSVATAGRALGGYGKVASATRDRVVAAPDIQDAAALRNTGRELGPVGVEGCLDFGGIIRPGGMQPAILPIGIPNTEFIVGRLSHVPSSLIAPKRRTGGCYCPEP